MKQFNLQEYLANPNRQVVTRDGRKVTRFLCTDANITFPLVALVEATPGSNMECLRTYTKDGNFFVDQISPNDLFFAPEKHKGWVNLYRGLDGEPQCGIIYQSEAEAKNCGSGMLATAKIEWEE